MGEIPDLFAEKAVVRLTEVQEMVSRRINVSSEISSTRCREALDAGQSFVVLRFGPMFGGKTEATLLDVLSLEAYYTEPRSSIHVFKLKGDDRYETDDVVVGSKSGLKVPAKIVTSIYQIIKEIDTGVISGGHVVAMVEFPFMCMKFEGKNFMGFDTEAIEQLVQLVRKSNIILIADGLGFWFNTQPLGAVETMIQHADLAFHMQGWNTVNPEQFADATLRSVRVAISNSDDLEILDRDGKSVIKRNIEKRKRFITRYIDALSREYQDLYPLLVKPVAHQVGYINIVFTPSHPLRDPLLVIGGPERYMPIGFDDLLRVYAAAGIDANLLHPDSFISRFSQIYDWSSISL